MRLSPQALKPLKFLLVLLFTCGVTVYYCCCCCFVIVAFLSVDCFVCFVGVTVAVHFVDCFCLSRCFLIAVAVGGTAAAVVFGVAGDVAALG